MLTIDKGQPEEQQFPISDEAYEMVLRAVDADGFDPWLAEWALDDEGWVRAKILFVQDQTDTGARVRFKETGGLLSYEFRYRHDTSRFTRRVLSWAELDGIPEVPMTVSFEHGRNGQLLTKIQHNDGTTEVQIGEIGR